MFWLLCDAWFSMWRRESECGWKLLACVGFSPASLRNFDVLSHETPRECQDVSSQLRAGFTSAEITLWKADTSIICKTDLVIAFTT